MFQRFRQEIRIFLRLAFVCGILLLIVRIAFHGKEDFKGFRGWLNSPVSLFKSKDKSEEAGIVEAPPIVIRSAPLYAGSSEYKPIPETPLEEVLRFDWTPAAISERWPRVSAAMPELDLQGYRTPILTGHAVDDLAGSITYYFDTSNQLRKMTFKGTTGDFRKLTGYLRTHYRFSQRTTNTPGVYVFEEKPKNAIRTVFQSEVKSFLWIRPAQILVEEKPMSRFDLTLVLTRSE